MGEMRGAYRVLVVKPEGKRPLGRPRCKWEISKSHSTTHHSRYDSSGRVISSSQRSLPDNTQHWQQTNIHAPGGIRTHNLSSRAAADLRLRPRGHWDRRTYLIVWFINNGIFLLTPTLLWQYYYPVGNTDGRYLLGTWFCWPAMAWFYSTFHNIYLLEFTIDWLFGCMDRRMDASVRCQFPQ